MSAEDTLERFRKMMEQRQNPKYDVIIFYDLSPQTLMVSPRQLAFARKLALIERAGKINEEEWL